MKLSTIIAILFVTLCSTSFAYDWVTNPANGHNYSVIFYGQKISWDDASVVSHDLGGTLVCIADNNENQFVFNLIKDRSEFWYSMTGGNILGPWLGAYQPIGSDEPAGQWTWETKEPFIYHNWRPGEPSNAGYVEDRLQFVGQGSEIAPYWNDVPNNGLLGGSDLRPNCFIVEVVPEPTTIGVFGLMTIGLIAKLRKKK